MSILEFICWITLSLLFVLWLLVKKHYRINMTHASLAALLVGKVTNKDLYLLCCKLLTAFIPLLKPDCCLRTEMHPNLKVGKEPSVSDNCLFTPVTLHHRHWTEKQHIHNLSFLYSLTEIPEDQVVWNSSAPDALKSCCPQKKVQG